MALKLLVAAFCFLGTVMGQCDYTQEVAAGYTYDIKSPNYPQRYPGGQSCRWQAVAQTGYKLLLSCGIFDIPKTDSNCNTDRVSISPSGAVDLSDAHIYCGKGTFSITSNANRLNMVLRSISTSQGGVFLCNISAVATATCDCGWKKQTRIVGGTETGVNEYPMMAGLVDSTLRFIYCGATLMSPHYAITAAHCLVKKNPDTVGLVVGEHDTSTGSETNATKLYRLGKFISHPNYDTETQENDIALVRTKVAISMSYDVMPVCLPFRFDLYDFTGQTVVVLGWGTTEFAGTLSKTLMQASLTVISTQQCKQVYEDRVTYKQMCTYAQGKDACQSDSGGPALFQDSTTGRLYLTGVISYGTGCATEQPGITTRVTSYLLWIKTVTADDTYCVI